MTKAIAAILVAFALPVGALSAQAASASSATPGSTELQGKNSTALYGNLGYTWNVSSFGSSVDGLDRSGPAANLRIMWRSKYLLAYGLEVGYTTRFSVSSSAGGATIDATSGAVPILGVFSMSPTRRLFVNVGLGFVFSTSSVDAMGSSASSSAFGSGFMGGVAYLMPVSKKLDLGAEFRFLRADTYNDNILSLQLTVAYRLKAH